MKRNIISMILCLVLCLTLATSAHAAQEIDYVVDEYGILADSEIADLNALAAEIYEERGIGIFYVFTPDEILGDYDVASLVGELEDYYIMLENDTSWYSFCSGLGENIDDVTEEELREVYDLAETYAGGVEDLLYAAAEYFPVVTDSTEAAPAGENFVYDDADFLTDQQETALADKLLTVSKAYNAQIVVATIDTLDGENIDEFVEYLYDFMEFGYGESHDGVLLLVCRNPREFRILSNGVAASALEMSQIEAITSDITPYLSDGDYAGAFDEFADLCDYYLNGYINGFPFDVGMSLLIALGIGLVAGLITASVLKGQLKSVRKQSRANVYVKDGSMQITTRNDLFLYRDVTQTEKRDDDNSSSSSSSRNVGGGSY